MREYCVSEMWAKHVTPKRRLEKSLRSLDETLNATSLAQEHLLACSRKTSATMDRQPQTFARNACNQVAQGVGTLWRGAGGRDLGKAPRELFEKMVVAEKASGKTLNYRLKNVDYKKPNCFGNPSFSFFRDRMTPKEREFV